MEGLVTQALLVANFEAAVEVCLHHNKMAEAMILAIAGGADLLRRTQKRYFKSNRSNLGRVSQKAGSKIHIVGIILNSFIQLPGIVDFNRQQGSKDGNFTYNAQLMLSQYKLLSLIGSMWPCYSYYSWFPRWWPETLSTSCVPVTLTTGVRPLEWPWPMLRLMSSLASVVSWNRQ